jgi:dinuclear metal center YbgI/SA1388 family protein
MNSIEVIKYLESKFPKELAYEWDNVGLQVGSLNKKVKKVLVTLDVTKEVVIEAVTLKADLIISHHPLIFKPINNVSIESPRGWMINQMIKHDIALYSMHTNYDLADGGMNDVLSGLLEIQNPKLLDSIDGIGRYGEIEPMSILDFIKKIKSVLNVEHVRLIGSLDKIVRIVGVSGGSGSNHVGQAKRLNCDVYLTGDVTYHTALDCIQMGLNVIDVGHYAEKVFKKAIAEELSGQFPEIETVISAVDSNPYQIL